MLLLLYQLRLRNSRTVPFTLFFSLVNHKSTSPFYLFLRPRKPLKSIPSRRKVASKRLDEVDSE